MLISNYDYLGGVAVRCKKTLSVLLLIVILTAFCCSPFISSASVFYIDGSASVCPGTTRTYVDPENYNYAWIDDVVMRSSSSSVVPLVLHPLSDYPYSHTAEEFVFECNNYAQLFEASKTILQSTFMKTLKTTYYTLLASGKITSSEPEMRAYNESRGITYPFDSTLTTHMYTTIVYALLKTDIASAVLKQEIEIPRGTSVEGAIVIYLSKVCGMNVPSSVSSIEGFSYLFANEYVLEGSGLPVSKEPTEQEVYYWVRVLAADKQGYEVDKTTPYIEVTQEQENAVKYAYYASILTSKYEVYVSPELLEKALMSSDSENELPKLVLKSMLDDVNTKYTDDESLQSLFEKAKQDGYFDLKDGFYTDIYNYDVTVSDDSTEVWFTAFLVADQLTNGNLANAKTYIDGTLVSNSSTNSVKLTSNATTFKVKIEYTDAQTNRNDSAEYTFTVKKSSAGSNVVGGVEVDLGKPVGDIIDSAGNAVAGYVDNGKTSDTDYVSSDSTAADTTSSADTTAFSPETYAIEDMSEIHSNFFETYPTDENGNVIVTQDPLATTKETSTEQAQNVFSGVTQTIKDKPEYVATPIGLLAVGASAGYIFLKKRKNDEVVIENADIDDVEIDVD